jgi:hypothetical protein
VALVRYVLIRIRAAVARRYETLGDAMNQGMERTKGHLRRLQFLALFASVVALPAASMPAEPPAPSVGQRALIEAHDTAGVGWWSSPALEVAPELTRTTDAPAVPLAPAAAAFNPKRMPGVESY